MAAATATSPAPQNARTLRMRIMSVALAFRGNGQNRAVGRAQVLLRRLLDQRRRHLSELVLEPVDLPRVVVEQRERGEQVGAAEPDELLVGGIQARPPLGQ